VVYFWLVQYGDKQLGLSARSSFTTPPAVGDGLLEQGGYVIGLVGDLGQTEDSAVTIRHILEEPLPLAVLHAGDLSYADCEQDRQVLYHTHAVCNHKVGVCKTYFD
jgi:hypothetical protein